MVGTAFFRLIAVLLRELARTVCKDAHDFAFGWQQERIPYVEYQYDA